MPLPLRSKNLRISRSTSTTTLWAAAAITREAADLSVVFANRCHPATMRCQGLSPLRAHIVEPRTQEQQRLGESLLQPGAQFLENGSEGAHSLRPPLVVHLELPPGSQRTLDAQNGRLRGPVRVALRVGWVLAFVPRAADSPEYLSAYEQGEVLDDCVRR